MANIFKHSLSIPQKQGMIDITNTIKNDIKLSGIKDGIIVVYCPHTTAGITIKDILR